MRYIATPLRKQTGGIAFRVTLISCTFIIIGFLIFFFLQKQQKSQANAHREALKIAEVGLQHALEQYNSSDALFTEIPKTEYDEGWYSVTTKRNKRNDSLYVTFDSEGHYGNISRKKSYILQLPLPKSDTL